MDNTFDDDEEDETSKYDDKELLEDQHLSLRTSNNISDMSNDDDMDWEMLDGVLRGSTALSISNYGGELSEILNKLAEDCKKIKR